MLNLNFHTPSSLYVRTKTKHQFAHLVDTSIMAYGSTPYVGMTPKKNGRHIKVHK